jgi:hypothetical protein
MQVSIDEIKQRLYSDFSNIYRAFGGFVDSGKLWDLCLEAVSDQVLMGNIIFCNDVHQIPPVHTFLKVVASEITWELTGMEKRSLGAIWGYVFKHVFGYQRQKSVTARVNTVQTATYFFDPLGRIEVKK